MSLRPGCQRGFALLIVLWLLVPLSVLFLMLSGTARSDSQLAFNLRDAAKLDAAADAGIATAIFALLDPRAGTGPLRLTLPGASVAVRVTGLSGLVNPNIAPPDLLRALLERLGAAPVRADRLASAIVDWRTPGQRARPNGAKAPDYRAAGLDYGPPGAPFESLDELRLVLGMTPATLAALLPSLTLYADRAPEPALAPPLIQAALADLGVSARGTAGRGDVFQISAEAAGPGGARVVRRATIKLGPSRGGRGWRVLSWETASATD